MEQIFVILIILLILVILLYIFYINNRKEEKVEKDIKSNELLPRKNYGLVKLKEIIEGPTGPVGLSIISFNLTNP